MPDSPKVIVTVLYPRQGINSFDMKYYLERHIPTTTEIWGNLGMTSCMVSEVEEISDYAVQTTMGWKDMESWGAAQSAKATQIIMDDVEGFKFTNVKPVTIVGTVKE